MSVRRRCGGRPRPPKGKRKVDLKEKVKKGVEGGIFKTFSSDSEDR